MNEYIKNRGLFEPDTKYQASSAGSWSEWIDLFLEIVERARVGVVRGLETGIRNSESLAPDERNN